MKNRSKFLILFCILILVAVLANIFGSASISLSEIVLVIRHKLFAGPLPDGIKQTTASIIWDIRFPRVILAFFVGASLSLCGVIMQSILQNTLASTYTIGLSSGAAFGASIAILFSFSFFGHFTLPFFGLAFSLLTVLLVFIISFRVDKNFNNVTIILIGMAVSYFFNAMITFIIFLSKENMQRIIFWQLGSLALKTWTDASILGIVFAICFVAVSFFHRELDLMAFGEEHAMASGIDTIRVKSILILVSSILTGTAVSLVGIIGFLDLFTPHIARKIFGSSNRLVMPGAALIGGIVMIACDIISRNAFIPYELPIGAVTGLIGTPFFLYIFFSKKKGAIE